MHFLKSLVFTVFSPKFYKEAVEKGWKSAWGVYFLFTFLVSLATFAIFAISFGIDLFNLPGQFEDFPDVRFADGELYVDAEMPLEYMDNGQYLGVDTTGEITEIPAGYNSGVLLTRDTMIVRSEDNYGDQVLSYNEIMTEMEIDSFELNSEKISSFIQSFGVIIIILSPVVIFLWKFLSTLVVILFIAILGFIIMSIMGQENSFSKSFLIAMYAMIPVFYVNLLIKIFNKVTDSLFSMTIGSLCCLIPIVLVFIKWGIFWGIGAYGVKEAALKK